MAALRNKIKEKFAQLVVSGTITKTDAYIFTHPRAKKWQRRVASIRAVELAKSPDVAERIEELSKVGADATIASRRELCQYLTRVVRTPIGEVTEKSDLAQEKTTRSQGGDDPGEIEKIRVPDKLGAIAQLAKLLGYNEPEQTEIKMKFEPDQAVRDVLGAGRK